MYVQIYRYNGAVNYLQYGLQCKSLAKENTVTSKVVHSTVHTSSNSHCSLEREYKLQYEQLLHHDALAFEIFIE